MIEDLNPSEPVFTDSDSTEVEGIFLDFSKEKLELENAIWSWQAVAWTVKQTVFGKKNQI
ncbi:MAG: hypothetical protein QXV17_11140 [Candidatus Micrarchaeaceae archaeon]